MQHWSTSFMPNKRAKGRERGREIERERLFTVPSRSLMVFKGSARGSGAPCLVSCLGIGAAPITAQRPCLGRGVSHPVQSGVTTFSDSLLRPARTPPCVCVCVCVLHVYGQHLAAAAPLYRRCMAFASASLYISSPGKPYGTGARPHRKRNSVSIPRETAARFHLLFHRVIPLLFWGWYRSLWCCGIAIYIYIYIYTHIYLYFFAIDWISILSIWSWTFKGF